MMKLTKLFSVLFISSMLPLACLAANISNSGTMAANAVPTQGQCRAQYGLFIRGVAYPVNCQPGPGQSCAPIYLGPDAQPITAPNCCEYVNSIKPHTCNPNTVPGGAPAVNSMMRQQSGTR